MYGDRPGGWGVCRDCMSRLTETFETATAVTLGGSPTSTESGPHPSLSDDEMHAELMNAWNVNSLIERLAESAEADEEEIETNLDGGDARESSDWVIKQVEIVRSLLVGRGYEEIEVSIGIDTELAKRRQLGSFYRRPDPENPRWVAHILFHRIAESQGAPTN